MLLGIAQERFQQHADEADINREMLDSIVVDFLKSRKSMIAAAVRSDVDDLHYCIALNEDTLENRCEILRFSANYKDLDFASRYPVYLQIVPQRLMGKVKSKRQIL